MLHIISKTLAENSLQKCIDIIALQKDADLLLYQDAIYMAIDNTKYSCQLNKLTNEHTIYAVNEDIKARGLIAKIANIIITIDYIQFVELTTKHKKIISW